MKKCALLLLAFTLVSRIAHAQPAESPENKAARMTWWKEAKFGLFIHWGLYAVAAGEYKGQKNYGEWLMYEAKIPIPEYEKFAPGFNPTRFDAEAWVSVAKNAGMKYIVITSKHHDGFSLFDSKVSDYDIIDRTPFKRDPLRELADACRKHGLKLCFYHSIMDWHHPQAQKKADFERYREEYLKPQLRELLTRYGDIGVLWFDGEWIDEWTEEQGKELYRFVRDIQPGIIINNRVGKGRNGMQGMNATDDAAGDFGTPEQEILGEKSALDWESCMTMNDHWGYNKNDKNFKSAEDLIWNLADITAKGGNYLLNVGPTAEGTFPQESIDRLKIMGEWTALNGEALYGSKPWTHWKENDNMRYVQGKNGSIYLFFKDPPGRELRLKKIRLTSGSSVQMLGTKDTLPWRQTAEAAVIQLPAGFSATGKNGRTWVLRLEGTPEDLSPQPQIKGSSNPRQDIRVFTGSTEVVIVSGNREQVYYSLDGSEPSPRSRKYAGPFMVSNTATVKAIAVAPGKKPSETTEFRLIKAKYGIRIDHPNSHKYTAQGPLSLADGVYGSTNFHDGNWLGFEGVDFSATIDLGRIQTVQSVVVSFLRVIPSWIFLPKELEIWYSDDGENFSFSTKKTLSQAKDADPNGRFAYQLSLEEKCRYIKVKARNIGVCPAWHPGAGGKSWVFVDEVRVNTREKTESVVELLPKPARLETGSGFFAVPANLAFSSPQNYSSFFKKYLSEKKGFKFGAKSGKRSVAYILLPAGDLSGEAYRLRVSRSKIEVYASDPAGFFYADQTLIQLMELNAENGAQIPCVEISDAPRFAWRGMHLDESRHFFGKAFVKQYLDWMAALKLNVFHWHLTDAQGWRLEIKKYPKLAALAAWRPAREGILFTDADTARAGEAMTYGGYYTQDDVREILAYAAERHITVLPEIEMPGHTTAALVAYPEYSCSGGPFPMPGGAKNCPYPNFCVGNEATIQFLQDILTEVIALFPSAYVHIGGDEVERVQWKSCARCQARKNALGLADEAQLQVDFTKRIEDFLRSKGRRLMGWDEIIEGGNLTPSAGVMVWRGENLLREALAAGHETVVTHNYYFDLYQGNPVYEPVTYGYKPLHEVYQYEPSPADLPAEQKNLVKGVQACLWSENVYGPKDAEYMLFPRLFALAEVAWTPAELKNWDEFSDKIPLHLALLDQSGVNYARSIYNPYPVLRSNETGSGLVCSLEPQIERGQIRYSLDGSEPSPLSATYQSPFSLDRPASIRAATYSGGKKISKTVGLEFSPSMASGKPFTLKYPPAEKYNGKRPECLTDGIGGSPSFHDGNWCGFYGDDFDLTIDLEKEQPIQTFRMNWLEVNGSWIYLPLSCTVSVSTDGIQYETVFSGNTADLAALAAGRIKPLEVPLKGKNARFVRIYGKNPGAHPVYPDGKCWLFVDEVRID